MSPCYTELLKSIKGVDKEVMRYIEKTKKDPNIDDRNDLIALFLKSDINGRLTDDILRDVVVNFTLAGRDTAATTLSWLFFEIMRNEEIQQLLIREIDTKLEGKVPSLEDLVPENMPYLNGVLYETLRLHPPVPSSPLVIQKETSFKGVKIPKGTFIMVSLSGMGLIGSKYPDPKVLKPERWIPFKKPTSYEFPVFYAGQRVCLGKDFAIFQTKLLVVKLLQKFRFRMNQSDLEKVTYSLGITQAIATDASDRKRGALACYAIKR